MSKNKENIYYICTLIIINIVCHGFIMLMTGVFWDDWSFVDKNYNIVLNQFLQSGQIQKIPLILLMWKLPSYCYRIIIWVIYTLTSILFYYILKKSGLFTDRESKAAALLYIVVPVNSCRIMLCTIDYGFNLLLFMTSFLLLLLYIENKRKILRFISVILLFFSYFQNPIVVFSLIIYIFLLIKEKNIIQGKSIFTVISRVLTKYFDYIFCPVLFVMIKFIFLSPSGQYENYTILNIKEVLLYVPYTVINVLYMLISVGKAFFRVFCGNRIIYICLFIIIIISLIFMIKKGKIDNRFKNIHLLLIGLLLLFLGQFTYVIAWLNPVILIEGVQSRYCLLLPIGMSIIYVFIIEKLIEENYLKDIVIVFIVILGIINVNYEYLGFQVESIWQQSLGYELAKNETVKDNNVFVLKNNYDLGADYGNRFYSINGISKYYAFMDESKFYYYVDGYHDDLENVEILENIKHAYLNKQNIGYLMDDFDFNDTDIDCTINFNMTSISRIDAIKITYLEYINHDEYEKKVKTLGRIEIINE